MRCTAILVSLALLGAFIEAPFLHIHQHEATQRHPGAFIHLHIESRHSSSGGPELRGLDPNEDAIPQGWFSATSTDSGLNTSIILTEPFRFEIPERTGWIVEGPLPVGHDPPLLFARSPRPPPA